MSDTDGDEEVEGGAGAGAGAGGGEGTQADMDEDVASKGVPKLTAGMRDLTVYDTKVEEGPSVTLGQHFKRVGIAKSTWRRGLKKAEGLLEHEEPEMKARDLEQIQPLLPGLVLARAPARHNALSSLPGTVTTSASSRGGSRSGDVTRKAKDFLDSLDVSFPRGANPQDIPVTAEHPILRDFATALRTARKDATTMGDLPPAFHDAVVVLCEQQQGWFNTEEEREEDFAERLQRLWASAGLPFKYDIYTAARGKGMVDISLVPFEEERKATWTKGSVPVGRSVVAMIEVKKERGSSGNPWPQLLTYSAAHTHKATVDGVDSLSHRYSTLPMPLLVVDGHELEFGATVAAMRPTLGQLDHMVQLQRPANDAYHALLVAKLLLAWIKAVDATRQEREGNLVSVKALSASKANERADELRSVLCFPSVELTKGGIVSTPRFVQHLARGVFRAHWDGTPVVIKFCRVNNDAMQAAVADGGLAPTLLHTEALVGESGSMWRILVMEDLWIQGFDALSQYMKLHTLMKDDEAAITEQIRAALAILHAKGYVFFDLRSTNVMIRRSKDKAWEVRLVDFEMCGKVGAASPPRRKLNPRIEWPPDDRLATDDDEFMLKRLFLA